MKIVALAKAKAKAKPVKKGKLNKVNLDKIAKMTLDQKLDMWKKEGLTPDQLKDKAKLLTKLEKSKIWNRHNTACKNDSTLKDDHDNASGKEAKGLLALAWNLDKADACLYQTMRETVTTREVLRKTNEWLTWSATSAEKGEQEATKMLESGRIIWQACPKTPNLFEYQDTMKITGSKTVEKMRSRTVDTASHQVLDENDAEGAMDNLILEQVADRFV